MGFHQIVPDRRAAATGGRSDYRATARGTHKNSFRGRRRNAPTITRLSPIDEQLSNPRKLGRPRLFRQRTSKSAPDDVDAMTTVTSFASSTRASSGRVVTDAGTTTPERTPASPPEQVAGLAERRSKRSAVVRLASAPLLDVDDEPLSP